VAVETEMIGDVAGVVAARAVDVQAPDQHAVAAGPDDANLILAVAVPVADDHFVALEAEDKSLVPGRGVIVVGAADVEREDQRVQAGDRVRQGEVDAVDTDLGEARSVPISNDGGIAGGAEDEGGIGWRGEVAGPLIVQAPDA